MNIRTAGHISLVSLFLLVPTESSTCHPDERSKVEILVQRVERISDDQARFGVSVTNRSGQSVFSTGIVYESGPQLYPLYLEQKRVKGGWQIVLPCIDTPPPKVIELKPAVSMVENLTLRVPFEGVCKQRNLKIEGKFRFRVDYFETETQAQLYLKNFLSSDRDKPHATIAVSAPFEVPVYTDQNRRVGHP